MRARWLKPDFFRDKKIAEMGPVAALVYQSLWCLADDVGVAPCEPERIKGEMFVWWSAVGVPEISGALRHLSGKKILTIYKAGDDVFCRLANFKKHQPIHKPSKHRNPSTGQPLTWDSEGAVPEIPGDSEAPPVNSTPRNPCISISAAREAFLAAVPPANRDGWIGTLGMWEDGAGAPGGRPLSVEHIDAGLTEYLATESAPNFSARHVVRYVEGVANRKATPESPRQHNGKATPGALDAMRATAERVALTMQAHAKEAK